MVSEIQVEWVLPKLDLKTWKGRIKFEKNRILVEGDFTREEVEALRTSPSEILQKLLPSALATPLTHRIEKERMKSALFRAYSSINEELPTLLEKCEISIQPGKRLITIDATKLTQDEIGRLLGKSGRTVKRVEEEIKARVRILQLRPQQTASSL